VSSCSPSRRRDLLPDPSEKHAAVFLKKVADRLPFVRAETVTALVQKVADRMKILFTGAQTS